MFRCYRPIVSHNAPRLSAVIQPQLADRAGQHRRERLWFGRHDVDRQVRHRSRATADDVDGRPAGTSPRPRQPGTDALTVLVADDGHQVHGSRHLHCGLGHSQVPWAGDTGRRHAQPCPRQRVRDALCRQRGMNVRPGCSDGKLRSKAQCGESVLVCERKSPIPYTLDFGNDVSYAGRGLIRLFELESI